MKVNETINSPHQSSRGTHKPVIIVMHIADGSYEGTKAWFLNAASQTSSHFIVAKDGRICQCVPLGKMAWCNGTTATKGDSRYYGNSSLEIVRELGGNANQYSVSIEFEGKYAETGGALTEAQLEAAVWLVGHIRDEVQRLYNHTIPMDRRYIAGHCEISPRTRPNCPGGKFPWDELMRRLQSTGAAAGVLYGVVGQKIALSDRAAAENYAKELNSKEKDGWYWKVIEITQ